MENRLKEIREKAGMTQEDLAERSGVARATISFLESGKSTNSQAKTLSAIAKALNHSVSDIFYPDRLID